MRNVTADRRLRRLESDHTIRGDVERATDAQLYALIRDGYRELVSQHGSLAKAAEMLRQTGDAGDAALAVVIEEDSTAPHALHFRGPRAQGRATYL